MSDFEREDGTAMQMLGLVLIATVTGIFGFIARAVIF